YLLDFLHPERGHRYNPLAHIRSSIDAHLVAETWVANTGKGKEAFWETLSKGMIANGLLLLACQDPLPPLWALRALLCQATPEQVLEIFEHSGIREVADGAASLRQDMKDNERMKGAAFADLQNRLQVLIHEPIRAATADNEIDLARFGARPTALYLRFDQDQTDLLAPLTATFYAQLFNTLMREAAARRSGRLAVPVMVYLEEFGNIGVLPHIQKKMAQLRGYGVGFWLVLQSLAQLEDNYGEATAGAIVGACWTRLCLAGLGTADGEAFSKLSGTRTVLAASQGEGRAITAVPWAESGNRGRVEAARPLVTPDELRTMGDRLFAVIGRRAPLVVRTRPWYRDPLLRRLVPGPHEGDPLADDFTRADPPGAGASPAVPAPLSVPPPALPRPGLLALPAPANPPVVVVGELVEIGGSLDVEEPPAGVDTAAASPPPAPASASLDLRLTATQRKVLVARAAAPAATAGHLGAVVGVKDSTVRDTLSKLRRRFAVADDAALVRLARERGLLEEAPAVAAD
ncbi:MAG: type IV secretory system conjugative DNA transfer family protein, partial [Chloroflexota bacterium]|nr:type IV secretory system conjugative DNA transfer family protein [Chloroflexota bacterium]